MIKDVSVKNEIKKLESLKLRYQIALDKLSAFSDERLKLKGSEENRLDFVRVWKLVPFRSGKPSQITLSNLCVRKGLKICQSQLQTNIEMIERNVNHLKQNSRLK
jgi:hypothetical protein